MLKEEISRFKTSKFQKKIISYKIKLNVLIKKYALRTKWTRC